MNDARPGDLALDAETKWQTHFAQPSSLRVLARVLFSKNEAIALCLKHRGSGGPGREVFSLFTTSAALPWRVFQLSVTVGK